MNIEQTKNFTSLSPAPAAYFCGRKTPNTKGGCTTNAKGTAGLARNSPEPASQI